MTTCEIKNDISRRYYPHLESQENIEDAMKNGRVLSDTCIDVESLLFTSFKHDLSIQRVSLGHSMGNEYVWYHAIIKHGNVLDLEIKPLIDGKEFTYNKDEIEEILKNIWAVWKSNKSIFKKEKKNIWSYMN